VAQGANVVGMPQNHNMWGQAGGQEHMQGGGVGPMGAQMGRGGGGGGDFLGGGGGGGTFLPVGSGFMKPSISNMHGWVDDGGERWARTHARTSLSLSLSLARARALSLSLSHTHIHTHLLRERRKHAYAQDLQTQMRQKAQV
jgi:hypothetical protein